MNIAMIDSFMAIFGFKRIASQSGNVITPAQFDSDIDDGVNQCDICGDYHEGEISRSCETGDGE